MKFLKLSQEERYTNILSERLFISIPSEVADKFPQSETVKFDEDEYKVFYNDALMKCSISHHIEHITQSCEYAYNNIEEEAKRNSIENEVDTSTQDQTNKRPLSLSTQSTSSNAVEQYSSNCSDP